jgi:hypothetical protein
MNWLLCKSIFASFNCFLLAAGTWAYAAQAREVGIVYLFRLGILEFARIVLCRNSFLFSFSNSCLWRILCFVESFNFDDFFTFYEVERDLF